MRFPVLVGVVLALQASPRCGAQEKLPQTRSELIAALNLAAKDVKEQQALQDAVLAQGAKGAELLLNLFYSQSIEPPTLESPRGQAWLRALQGRDLKESKAALLDLHEFGPVAEPLLKRMAEKVDPAARLWLRGVAVSWEETKLDPACGPFFWDKLLASKDAATLELLARRVVVVVSKKGEPAGWEENILDALGERGEDRFLDPLVPLLDHPDIKVARAVVQIVSQRCGPFKFPTFRLKALSHKRAGVVEAALGWTLCWDEKKQPEVRRLLRAIFTGDNETLKFASCFSLAAYHEDAEAFAYLVRQTESKDPVRVKNALGTLGDNKIAWKPAPPELVKALTPLLGAPDAEVRYWATWALGRYKGEAPIRKIIPQLADREARVATAAHDALLNNWTSNWDRAALRRHLEAARDDDVFAIQSAAHRLLEKMGAK